jgi:hypothetical protein
MWGARFDLLFKIFINKHHDDDGGVRNIIASHPAPSTAAASSMVVHYPAIIALASGP